MIYQLKSLLTFLTLYGVLAAVASAIYFGHNLSVPLITGIAIAILVLQYLLGPIFIRWLLNIDWQAELPARNQEFLKTLCERENLPLPRVGIIHGALPNAFTFGRVQSDASIVVTTGLLEALTPEEVNAVIAHEAGHIKHWDFLTMTLASIVPLLLYQIYNIADAFDQSRPAAWVAYIAYWLSRFLVLSLSRTREFWADHFAATATTDAAELSSALVKICYGMAKVEREGAWATKHGDSTQRAEALRSTRLAGTMGVMGISTAQAAFVLSGPSPEGAALLMRWDLENPWARIYQLWSTHPLTAFRIEALNRQAVAQGRDARYPLPQDTRIRWAAFPVELALWATPWILGASLLLARGLITRHWIAASRGTFAVLAAALLVTWILRIAYRYRGQFTPTTIRSLAEDTTPSEMCPRAVRIEGEIVGRGQPEAFWSPDLVIKDDTGILFVLDRQTIPLARLVFAMEVDDWIGQRVTIDGWYRRGMMPYVELSTLKGAHGDPHRSYSRWFQMGIAVVVSVFAYWYVGR